MLRARILIRPQRAELLVQRLMEQGWAGSITAVECRGYGRQRGDGVGPALEFLPKVLVECVLPDDRRDALIELACATGRSGRIGDGKIWLQRIDAEA